MRSLSNIEIRRCRPLLGTFVEITASGLAELELHRAANAAFDAIETIQRLLSTQDPQSELSVLNREGEKRPVTVSFETFELLRRAQRLAAESNGGFDFTVAPTLAEWGILPARLRRENAGDWRDLFLLRNRRVRFRCPMAVDLGGIAKGFAVDKAVETLRERGVTSAVVNAGGDLRAFGAHSSIVHLRHPARPQTFVHVVCVRQGALATSSPCFTERRWRGRRVSHLVNPLNLSPVTGAISVTVRAPECWLADALTKVVLVALCKDDNARQVAHPLLESYTAEAFVTTS